MHMVSFSFDHHPRMLVPTGQEHQADIPEWEPYIDRTSSSSEDMGTSFVGFDEDYVGKYMGACVIQMPDEAVLRHSAESGHKASECICSDSGSVRCGRQYIEEARESLLKSLGRDRCIDLEFHQMGEEVAHGWSVEDKQVFREVVYMNPKNFWHCLSKKFPSHSQKDLVSYCYNVFMLRIRATQNRCHVLEIDSDDDEWHGETLYSYAVHDDECEGSQLEPALDQDDENCSDDECNRGFSYKFLEWICSSYKKDMNITREYQCRNKSSGEYGDICYASVSDYASYPNIPTYSDKSGQGQNVVKFPPQHAITLKAASPASIWGLDCMILMKVLCGALIHLLQAWNLVPTSNMIEEIFGSGSCDKKSTDDGSSH